MDVRHFNLKRAEEERRKAATASDAEAREGHRVIAEIFEARAAVRERDEQRALLH